MIIIDNDYPNESEVHSKAHHLRVLFCPNVDLNLIDGSSVWAVSLIKVLIKHPQISVTILLKRPIIRTVLISSILSCSQVQLIEPARQKDLIADSLAQAAGPADATARLIYHLDHTTGFDIVIIRGFALAAALCSYHEVAVKTWAYITDFPQLETEVTIEQRALLKQIHDSVAYLLCQTGALRSYFQKIIAHQPEKLILLPPMVPDYPLEVPVLKNSNNRFVYVGKFAPLWYNQEMIVAFQKFKNGHHQIYAQFHLAGDKFNQDPKNPHFKMELLDKLQNTPGVFWHQALSQTETESLVKECDIGISWRHPELDNSLELSTKIFEYGRLGKPVILNRNPLHESIFGTDYPFYANNEVEFISCLASSLQETELYRMAAKVMYEKCKQFTYQETYNNLVEFLH